MSHSNPSPQAEEAQEDFLPAPSVEPTRYGDWEHNGRCIDF